MAERFYLQGSDQCQLDEVLPRGLMFDANVWLSIGGPFPDKPKRVAAYSAVYKRALESGAEIFIPQIVAGEFLNRAVVMLARADGHDGRGKIHAAANYGAWIKEACDLLHAILGDHTRLPDGFDALEMEPCYAAAEAGGLEFHDILIASLCRRNGLTLVTDDADYKGQDIPIITWNQQLS